MRAIKFGCFGALVMTTWAAATFYFELRDSGDPSWVDSFSWAVILICPIAFIVGQALGLMVFGAVVLIEWFLNALPSR